ncbi:uncharacterized protein [Malus domestica]|uniref:uncharacterized protein n=1 Tax=Malus domestica TaxID=3750 RepID=UPI003974E927
MIMDFLSSKFESCKTEAKELQAIFVCLSLLSKLKLWLSLGFELFKRLLFEEGYYKSSYLCAYVALPPRHFLIIKIIFLLFFSKHGCRSTRHQARLRGFFGGSGW